ncbi:hypothetical protein AB0C76_19765 [Kitasatospora sp. NPDC048722]|uniref:RICIN domain-containing protein n=1 Tax=Kitasatospora sp. NPDC048722 TaxID=3155639 RepID=UPI0033C2F684
MTIRNALPRARTAAGATGAALALAAAAPATPASAIGGSFGNPTTSTLVNVDSGKCLKIADWRTDNGAPARQWQGGYAGVAQANQAWITAVKRY